MNNFGFSTEYAAFSRGDMVELGHNMDHEGTDYYTTLLRQTALDRELQKQHKKHGTMEEPVATDTPNVQMNFERSTPFLMPGQKAPKKEKKDHAERLRKLMKI